MSPVTRRMRRTRGCVRTRCSELSCARACFSPLASTPTPLESTNSTGPGRVEADVTLADRRPELGDQPSSWRTAVELSTARRAFVATRLVIGATFALVPELARRGWLGAGPGAVTGSVALRAMGARDVALSVGALVGERARTDVRPWLFAAAWSEAADALAVLAVARQLPREQRVVASVGPALLATLAVTLARRTKVQLVVHTAAGGAG